MWYRVYVGAYPTEEEARKAAGQLIRQAVVGSYLLRKLDARGEYLFSVDRKTKNLLRADLKTEEKERLPQFTNPAKVHKNSERGRRNHPGCFLETGAGDIRI